ncbi:hypothetical protein PoB_005966400 [Plakobranchus ocellatus]|uniref:Uncharacterized protein n=1 Tax=Plakobranchus ocellatus TaxID=259542 RepID=A0AAV4CN87_9GAST|nr:hypothetical protein PoB_005966400 [Plakobranchus ocellatus]
MVRQGGDEVSFIGIQVAAGSHHHLCEVVVNWSPGHLVTWTAPLGMVSREKMSLQFSNYLIFSARDFSLLQSIALRVSVSVGKRFGSDVN